MENICHTLTGWAIARSGINRLSPGATATCLVAANLPDIDIVTLLQGELSYLQHHRGITHAFAGLAVESVLLAAAAWGAQKLWRRSVKARFAGLLAASSAGLFSHLALDWTNSYGVRPWLPFGQDWYYGDLVFVVDPWLWLLFGGALFLGSTALSRAAFSLWLSFFAVLAGFVGLSAFLIAPDEIGAALWIWLAALIALFGARFWKTGWNATRLARGALAGYLVYLAALGIIHSQAIAAAERMGSSVGATGVAAIDANPLPMRPDRWRLFVMTPDKIFTALYHFEQTEPEITSFERKLDSAETKAALATCPGRVAADFGRYLRAEVITNETLTVDLLDERFPPQNNRRPIGQISIRLDANLKPLPDARNCPK